MTLNVAGDYSNTGTLAASSNLTVNANHIDNSGVLSAVNTLTANAQGNLTNTGEMSGGSVLLSASGTLTNQGLVNSTAANGTASLRASTVDNTGRVYGDFVQVQGNTIANSGSGVIAARQALSLGGGDISNTGSGALLLSLGDLNLGANVDAATGAITGFANSFTNTAARTEAAQRLNLAATTILNANGGVQTTMGPTTVGAQTSYVIPSGSTTQYPLSQCVGIGGGQDDNYCILHPEVYGQRSTVPPAYSVIAGTCSADSDCTADQTVANYSWNSPMFARFSVTPVSAPPAEPGGSGGCSFQSDDGGDSGTYTTHDVDSPACNQWRVDYATWNTGYTNALNQLDAAIAAYNAEVNRDNATVHFEDYTLIQATPSTQRTQVTASTPGQILSGGDMTLTGTSITNRDSRIVAGGLLYVNGQAGTTAGVSNVATQGQEITTYSGTTQFSYVESCGYLDDHCRRWNGVQPYDPAPSTTSFDLPTVVMQQNAQALQGGSAQGVGTAVTTAVAGGAGSVGATTVGDAAGRAVPAAQASGTVATTAAASSVRQASAGLGIQRASAAASSGVSVNAVSASVPLRGGAANIHAARRGRGSHDRAHGPASQRRRERFEQRPAPPPGRQRHEHAARREDHRHGQSR